MEDSVDPADIVVEGPESDSQSLFPVVGTDRTPTPQMIADGHFGNGSWDLNADDVQVAYAERYRRIQEDRDERRRFFNDNAKDALADSIALHHKIVKRGLDVMERLEAADEERPVTAKDMAVLSMAQKSAKEVADRGMGRAKAAQEEHSTETILSLITKAPS